MNIAVRNDNSVVVVITSEPITLTASTLKTGSTIYADLNETNTTVYNDVSPPTNHPGRYTYDGNTFTDTWPYAELSRVQFLDALQNHGGVSDSDLVASRQDANLGAFWIKFELANSISRDDAKTIAGLDALIATGYLDSAGKQAVLDNWPRARP